MFSNNVYGLLKTMQKKILKIRILNRGAKRFSGGKIFFSKSKFLIFKCYKTSILTSQTLLIAMKSHNWGYICILKTEKRLFESYYFIYIGYVILYILNREKRKVLIWNRNHRIKIEQNQRN